MPDAVETNGASPSWFAGHPRMSGALLLLALHAVLLPFAGAYLGAKPEAGFYLIGIFQLFYVIPSLILLLKLGYLQVAKGMAFAALATFIVNAAGCGFLLWGLSQIEG
jgi:hypothetical protein